MRIIVFDPQIAMFGHHVHFNRQVLRLLSTGGFEVTFLDLDGLMRKSFELDDVRFVDLTRRDLGEAEDRPLIDAEFKFLQKSTTACEALWRHIQSLQPDLVLVTSESTSRKQLFGSIPAELVSRVLVTAHAVWSLLRTLESDAALNFIFQQHLGGVFVIEPFLVDALLAGGIRAYWFPHRSYSSAERDRCLARSPRPGQRLRIGTVGVINERRNHKFLIDAVSATNDIPLDYIVAGELMPSVRQEVIEAVEAFRKGNLRRIHTIFSYLEDADFNDLMTELDLGLLAYDSQRNLQASGAIYSYAEHGVPLMVPDIDLFRDYSRTWPDLLQTYPELKASGLGNALREFHQRQHRGWVSTRYLQARERFFLDNDLDVHSRYLSQLLQRLTSTGKMTPSFFALGNKAYREGRYLESQAQYLAAIVTTPNFSYSYENCAHLRMKLNDGEGASRIRTLEIAHCPQVRSCDSFMLKEGGPIDVLIWPAFNNSQDLKDFLVRFYWHFRPVADFISKVHVFCEEKYEIDGSVNPSLSQVAADLKRYFFNKIKSYKPEAITQNKWSGVNLSLIWRYLGAEERKYPLPKTCTDLYKKPIWRVDERRERFATSHLLKAVSALVDLEDSRQRAARAFERVHSRFTSRCIAVFGTGPSLSVAIKESFEGVDTIAANSMVKNIELLDHLRPKLFVCADPIFHAGVSTYAEEFRQKLRYALHRYCCPLVVPERDLHIYHQYFQGDAIEVIPVPLVKKELPNYSMTNNFSVTSTGNVLTLFLLQIAFSFVDEVEIYGCDGRPAEQNSYFWGHDKSAQFNERMDDIKRAHPGFFDIDYDDYYYEHCNTLEKWLAYAESLGKQARSRSFSYIDALKCREFNPIFND